MIQFRLAQQTDNLRHSRCQDRRINGSQKHHQQETENSQWGSMTLVHMHNQILYHRYLSSDILLHFARAQEADLSCLRRTEQQAVIKINIGVMVSTKKMEQPKAQNSPPRFWELTAG